MGHAVNAVYAWSLARAFGGTVLLRIEDHDRRRARAAYGASILENLVWLGLEADNAALRLPAPLWQHDRDEVYDAALARLTARGLVYVCRCSRRDVSTHAGATDEDALRYPGTCRTAAISPLETTARRVRLVDAHIEFNDLRHGPQVQVPQSQCGDLLVRDRLGQWTYQFAVVVDDLEQRVDLVIRGDDLLDSTGRQFALATLLGREVPPLVLHHALIRRPDGTKLSKSQGDTGIAELRAAGWSAERVLGHAAWLGGLQRTAAEISASALGRLWTDA
jgi:glutamyl-Q tRNA(Asp) synthetase